MVRILRFLVRWGGRALVLLLVLLGAAWLFRGPLFSEPLRSWVSTLVREETGLELTIGSIEGSWLLDVELRDVVVEDPTGEHVIASGRADRVAARWSLRRLLAGHDDWIESVEIEGVEVTLSGDALERPAEPPAEEPGEVDEAADPPRPRSFVVRDAAAAIRWRDGRTVDLGGLEIEGGARSDGELAATVRVGRLEGTSAGRAAGLSGFEATVALAGGDANASVSFALLGGRGEATGTVAAALGAARITGTVQLDGIDPPDWILEAFGSTDVTRVGRLDVRVELADLDPAAWREGGRAEGRIALSGVVVRGHEVRRAVVAFDGTATDARLDVTIDAGDLATVTASGRAGVEGPLDLDLAVTLARLEDLPLAGLLEGVPRGRLELTGTARGTAEAPVVAGVLMLTRPGWDGFTLDSARIEGRWAERRVDLETLEVRRGHDHVTVSGAVRFGPEGEITLEGIRGDTSIADLAALAEIEAIAAAGVSGSVEATFAADGPANDPTGHARLTVRDLVADERRVDRLDLHVTVAPGEIALESLAVAAPEGTIGIALAGRREGWSSFEGAVTKLEATVAETGDAIGLRQEVRVAVAASGAFEIGEARLEGRGLEAVVSARGDETGAVHGELRLDAIDLEALAAQLGSKEWRGTGTLTASIEAALAPDGTPTARVRVGGRDATITRGEETAEIAEIEVAIDVERERVQVGARVDSSFAAVEATVEARPAAAGERLRDTLEASGPGLGTALFDAVRFTGTVTVQGRDLASLPLPEGVPIPTRVEVQVAADESAINVTTLDLAAAGVTVVGSGRLEHTRGRWTGTDLTLKVDAPDLSTVAAVREELAGLAGQASIEITAGGTPDVPTFTATVRAQDVTAPDMDPFQLDLVVSYAGGEATITEGELTTDRGSVRLSGRASGVVSLMPFRFTFDETAPVELTAASKGEIDLSTFAPLLAGTAVRSLQGFASFDITVSGPGGAKRSGTLRIRDGRTRFGETRRPVDDLQAVFELADRRLEIAQLSARVGGATLEIGGHVDLRRTPAEIVVTLKGKRVLLTDQTRMRVRGDIDLTYSSGVNGAGGPLVRGRVDRLDVRYAHHIPYFERRPTVTPLPLSTDPAMRELKLDVDVTSQRIVIDNNLARARFKANLHVGGTAAFPEVQGLVFAEEGRVRLPTAVFTIENATLDFEATRPLSPLVSFRGTTRRGRWTVTALATGRPDDLAIDLISEPPLAREDIISVLATGVPTSELSGSGSGESLAFAGGSMLLQRLSWSLRTDEDAGETGFLEQLVREIPERTEFSTSRDPRSRQTSVEATFRILDWLRLRGESTGEGEVNVDVLFRVIGG